MGLKSEIWGGTAYVNVGWLGQICLASQKDLGNRLRHFLSKFFGGDRAGFSLVVCRSQINLLKELLGQSLPCSLICLAAPVPVCGHPARDAKLESQRFFLAGKRVRLVCLNSSTNARPFYPSAGHPGWTINCLSNYSCGPIPHLEPFSGATTLSCGPQISDFDSPTKIFIL